MTTPDDRQTCYDYLLESLPGGERASFESRLPFDTALAAELKRCESDLADYAQASVRASRPPERVWRAVQAGMRGEARAPVSLAASRRAPGWSAVVWPFAALFLLGLNAWQYSRTSELLDASGEVLPASAAAALAESRRAAAEAQSEIERLNARLAALEGAAGGADPARESVALERDRLAERLENLEVNYLSLVEVAESLMNGTSLEDRDPLLAERAIELLAQRDGSRMVVSGGLWERVAMRRGDRAVAPLSAEKLPPTYSYNLWTVGNTYHVRKVLEESPQSEPYALAFVDPMSQQAIFSFGNLPELAAEEELVLWIHDEIDGGYAAIGELPRLENGAAGNVAARIPDGYEVSSDFVLSLESDGMDGKTAPGERVVLRTVSER